MDQLRDLATRLAVPGLPDWTGLLALLVLLLLGLAFVLMPFAVFGVKGRLDAVEAQLEALTAELRASRLQEPQRRTVVADDWSEPLTPRRATDVPTRPPPVPPPPAWPERRSRAEPRF